MTLEKCIEQLKDLRSDRESFLDGKYNPELDKGKPEFEDNPFVEDIEAIDTALAAIENLKEAKRLLKAALKDMNVNNICDDENACNVCAYGNCVICSGFEWRYTEEAVELIEEEAPELHQN